MTYTDTDAIRKKLAMMGQFMHLGTDSVNVSVALHCDDGRVYHSRQPTEIDCLIDIHDRMQKDCQQ